VSAAKSESLGVSGTGEVKEDSAVYTTTAAGTYYWIASYNGDKNNKAVSGKCEDANESSVVNRAQPKIKTKAVAEVTVGEKIKDTATLTGLVNAVGTEGTVTFKLFSDSGCHTEVSAAKSTVTGVSGSGTVDKSSAEYATTEPGTYYWIASYSGDKNNAPASTKCGDSEESSKVFQKTGALTMGFWQNKNGQGIISGVEQEKLGSWLRGFNPFSDAPSTRLASYVSSIIKAATCSSSANTCNLMLRAQMLATALDVYFSDPALGGNKIGAFNGLGTKQPIVGGVMIDLTKICHMIDSTGGSATCSGVYENASSAFGPASTLTVLGMLTYQNTADPLLDAGAKWYEQVKATQVLAKDAFDAVNNDVAF